MAQLTQRFRYGELREQRQLASYHAPGTPPMSILGDTASTYAGMLTADELKDVDKSNDEERGERPPAWLDLVRIPHLFQVSFNANNVRSSTI